MTLTLEQRTDFFRNLASLEGLTGKQADGLARLAAMYTGLDSEQRRTARQEVRDRGIDSIADMYSRLDMILK